MNWHSRARVELRKFCLDCSTHLRILEFLTTEIQIRMMDEEKKTVSAGVRTSYSAGTAFYLRLFDDEAAESMSGHM